MTPQQKLHAVETAIRKALPRLMEPTENCYLEVDVPNEGIITFKSNGTFNWYGENYISLVNVKLQLHNKIKLSSNRYKIIGHDILLNDVLEWLNAINELNTSVILRKEVFEFQRIDKENKLFIVGWDLSKPRLADQSGKLINLLHNLINDN